MMELDAKVNFNRSGETTCMHLLVPGSGTAEFKERLGLFSSNEEPLTFSDFYIKSSCTPVQQSEVLIDFPFPRVCDISP